MKCKHKYKELIQGISFHQYGDVVNRSGKRTEVEIGEYELYRCLECKCVVWESARGEK